MHTKFAFAIAAAIGIGTVQMASAADMPVKARPMAPPPVLYDWNGFYVGGHIGGAWDDKTTTSNAVDHFGLPGASFGNSSDSTFLGGVQLGYNWQFAPNWLVGIEGTWSWTDLNNDSGRTLDTRFGGQEVSTTAKINQIWAVTGRLGYIWNNSVMIYVAGGFADGHINAATYDYFPVGGPVQHSGFSTGWRGGWTVGGGVEYMFAKNWIAGIDYKSYDLGDYNHSGAVQGVGVGAPVTFDETIHTQINSVVFRLSYLFNWHP
jgi:outer membrane immunogenic protein